MENLITIKTSVCKFCGGMGVIRYVNFNELPKGTISIADAIKNYARISICPECIGINLN
jgi:hypothetical protein